MSHKTRTVSCLLSLMLFSGALAPAGLVAQQQQRQRRVSTTQSAPATGVKPTPTPASGTKATPTPTPATKPSPPQTTVTTTRPPANAAGSVAPTAGATSPTGLAAPAAPRRAAPATVEELRAGIQEAINQSPLASSHLAVKIVSLDTGRTLYEENANKWLQPASNMKLYTVAAALDRLTPDYRFITSVYATTRPDAAGTVRGELIVYGRGDPSFATRFTGGTDPYAAIDELAARIVAGGVRRVEGDLVGDESYFSGGTLASGWEWDDLQWYYGAEISALTINDNAVDLAVKPGLSAGDACVVTINPATPLVTIVNRTTTTQRGTPRELRVHRPLGLNVIEVSGTMPLDGAYSASVAISRPALMFVTMLRASLEKRGVVITGQTRTIDALARANAPLPMGMLTEVASRQSPPLSVIAAQTLKPSQNLYTELILRALGKASSADPKQTSEGAGIAAVKSFLGAAGINPDRIVMVDGSGLSRGNLVTAEATLQLLTFMSRHRYAAVFRDAQPVAGVDGTLRNRMKDTPAAGNARAKTGTLGTANSLSGYVTSAAGERLAFALMINNPPRDADARTLFIDAVTVLLASFAGHS